MGGMYRQSAPRLGSQDWPHDYHAYMEFAGLGIPEGATINSASLSASVTFFDGNGVLIVATGVDPNNSIPPGSVGQANGYLSGGLGGSGATIPGIGSYGLDATNIIQAIVNSGNHRSYKGIKMVIGSYATESIAHLSSSLSLYVNWEKWGE